MSIIRRQTDELLIRELEATDLHEIGIMQTIFTSLMPQYAHYAARLERDIEHAGSAQSASRHHVWLIEMSDTPVAMCAFEYVRSHNVGLGMDIAVYPEYRGVRIGDKKLAHYILTEMVGQLALDGAEAGQSPAVPMGGEVDNDRLMARYIDYGFVSIPATYYEPPDVTGKSDIPVHGAIPFDAEHRLEANGYHPMRLGFFPPTQGEFDILDTRLWERLITAFYVHHYNLSPHTLALQLALASLYHPPISQPTRSVA